MVTTLSTFAYADVRDGGVFNRLSADWAATDQITITPDAKPSSIFWSKSGIAFFIKKTNAAPIAVPRKGISSARNVLSIVQLFGAKLLLFPNPDNPHI